MENKHVYLGHGYTESAMNLNRSETLVLTYLIVSMDKDNNYFGSNIDIHEGTSFSQPTVSKAIKTLQKLDCIRQVKRLTWMINPRCGVRDPKLADRLIKIYDELPVKEK